MKKLLIILVVALFGITMINAQDLTLGAKGGVNFASISGDGTDGFDSRTSLHLGIVSEIMLSDKFSIQPELLYSAQGADYTDPNYKGVTKLDYLNLPLMGKYYVAEGFSLEVGPQVGFLLSAKDDWEDVQSGETGVDDIKDKAKGIDFGVNFGLGYKLNNGLNFGVRYNLGLSKINDVDTFDIIETSQLKYAYIGNINWNNRLILFFIGYTFINPQLR